MDNSKYIIEKIKTVILVVLFIVTILLLYFFWKDVMPGEVKLPDFGFAGRDELVETVSAEEVLYPTHIDLCFGNGTYTKSESRVKEYWTSEEGGMLDAFKAFVSSGDEFIEEITEKQYDDIMEFVSARAVFDYYLPFKDYCAFLGVSGAAGAEMISVITEVGFSEGSSESMFVYDGEKDKYFRIVSDVSSENFFEAIETVAEEENTTYFPLQSFVGADLKREILVPSYLEASLNDIPAAPDFSEGIAAVSNDIARSFFSDSFDFVRKIQEESGRTIYIYGYGEKMLTIDTDGSVSYRSDVDSVSKVGFFDSLRIALATVSQQGGFITSEGTVYEAYLLDAEALPAGNGYRFEFGVLSEGERVYYHDDAAVNVEIVNGQVSSFVRKYIEFTEPETADANKEAHSAINVLAMNYEYIYDEITEKVILDSLGNNDETIKEELESITNADDKFMYVVSRISGIGYGYVYEASEGVLKPCYVVSLFDGEVRTFFDLYTAIPFDNGHVGITGVENGLG